jgi:acetyl-CoA carboxylase carboxyltransferase component
MTAPPVDLSADSAAAVSQVLVSLGDSVAAGQPLVVTEMMKMQREHLSPAAGHVTALPVAPGDMVAPGDLLARIAPSGAAAKAEAPKAGRTDLAELEARLHEISDAGRPDAVAKRHAKGRTARENLSDLLDPGSFSEYGALAVAAQRTRFSEAELRKRSPADGIVTGAGAIGGAPVAVMAVDYTVMAGTQGYFHHAKMDRLLAVARDRRLPIVLFAEGGGGRPNDVDVAAIHAAMLNVTSFRAFARLSGVAPRIAIVHGYCFAGNAALAGVADVIIATEKSYIGMGGPAMIEGGGLGLFAPEEVGPSAVQHANGVIDILVAGEAEAVAAAKKTLAFFTGDASGEAPDQTLLRDAVPENRRLAYDIRPVIDGLFDADSVQELRAGFAPGIVTALARLGGRAVGVIANNCHHLGGAIDADGADKAARFLQLCDSFGLPVVSLIDTPGFMVGPKTEETAQVRHVSRLALAGANFAQPFFAVILRKGYGLGAMAMAGGDFHRPDFTVAWPTGEIGPMGLEGAVRLGARDQLAAIEDPAEREAEFERQVAERYASGKALSAAAMLEFDAVIDPAETRAWLLRGLAAAGPGRPTGRTIDAW